MFQGFLVGSLLLLLQAVGFWGKKLIDTEQDEA